MAKSRRIVEFGRCRIPHGCDVLSDGRIRLALGMVQGLHDAQQRAAALSELQRNTDAFVVEQLAIVQRIDAQFWDEISVAFPEVVEPDREPSQYDRHTRTLTIGMKKKKKDGGG